MHQLNVCVLKSSSRSPLSPLQVDRDEYMDHYHKRSNIEATNAAIKRKLGKTLKSKNSVAQINEMLAKIVAYNLTVVIHEMHENGIEPEFLKVAR